MTSTGVSGVPEGQVAAATGINRGFRIFLSPPGNSVKGQLVARFLAEALGLDVFVSAPADPVRGEQQDSASST